MTKNGTIYLVSYKQGVCIGGRFDGWLMRQAYDGRWVSVRALDKVDPAASAPAWLHPTYYEASSEDAEAGR